MRAHELAGLFDHDSSVAIFRNAEADFKADFRDFAARYPRGIAVIEAAILVEADRHTFFDKLILTACSVETQIARGMKRDLLTREQVIARLQKQMPLEQKKPFAHYVIDTDGPKPATLLQVETVFRDLEKLAGAKRV